jgi:murein L,D-transpeptidase YcbB/YkuD
MRNRNSILRILPARLIAGHRLVQPRATMGVQRWPLRHGLYSRLVVLAQVAVAAALLAGVTASTVYAQDTKWWQSLPGFGPPAGTSARKHRPKPKKPLPLSDLRDSPVPLRSDEMLDSMDKAIERFKRIVARGGWPRIGKTNLMRPGDDNEAIAAVRRRLVISGDIPDQGASYNNGSYHYDEWVEYGVKRFQRRHGLRESGKLDRPTRAQLDVTAQARLQQLELNRRRIAALAEGRIEDRYVLVNVPAFQLEAVERFEVARRHRVIVGKPNRQTPAIAATIKGLNFFPFWRVPESVAKLDLIPRLVKEPEYLQKEHIRIVQGRFDGPEIQLASVNLAAADTKQVLFRQDPGPWNALGLVRIDMPNKHIVYMHDTPMKPLFKQPFRAFSAGCVRVEGVMDLVGWIAKYEPGLSGADAISRLIEQGHAMDPTNGRPKELDITLTRPIPVIFTYVTAWAERDGTVAFRPDIYGRDGASELVGDDDPDAPPPPASLSP